MLWPDINNIILPLFLTTASPVAKERDAVMNHAHKKVMEYCKNMPMAKQPDYSYLCRIQIESDCLDSDSRKACDLLVELQKWEKKGRVHHIAEKEKNKDTTYICTLDIKEPMKRIPAGEGFREMKIRAGSISLVKDPREQVPPKSQAKVDALRVLGLRINSQNYPVSCNSDADCKVMGTGKRGCGGYEGFIYYSVKDGVPPLISEIQQFNTLDHELNQELGGLSICSYEMSYIPQCSENACGPSATPQR